MSLTPPVAPASIPAGADAPPDPRYFGFAAIAAIGLDPAATIFHRAILLTLAALSRDGGDIPPIRDSEFANMVGATVPTAKRCRQWLTNRGFLIATRNPDRTLALRLGPAVMQLAHPDRLDAWLGTIDPATPAAPEPAAPPSTTRGARKQVSVSTISTEKESAS